MVEKDQCNTHTRTPWGTSPHRYDPRLRYFLMGLLVMLVLSGAVLGAISIAYPPYNYNWAGSGDGNAQANMAKPSTTGDSSSLVVKLKT